MLPGRTARDDGVAKLLRRLLSAFSVALLIGMGVLIARDVIGGDSTWLAARLAATIVLVVATAALLAGPIWPLGRLRVIEVAVFATMTLYLARQTYSLVVLELSTSPTPASWNAILLRFGLLMVSYGIFIPNSVPRAVVGILSIGVTPLVTVFVVRAIHPELGAAIGAAAATQAFETTLVLASSAGVAIFAAFLTYSLFDFAFEQRKRTFYDLEERIGSGGMGEVWRARHHTLARPTAIKLIRVDKIEGVEEAEALKVLQRFEREAKATAAMRSPHTIDVYDFGVTADGHFFYAMEYLEGLDLEMLVERFGPVPPERVVHFLLQACDSLADAHDRGLTHRDIKPANLYLSHLGTSCDYIKVLDFGIVKLETPVNDTGKLTADGSTSGTPAYMAPEMALAQDDVDGRADIYALGCVAYWLLTGKQVFEGSSSVAVIVEHVKTMPTPPSARTELPLPPQLEAIVMKCLEKNPEDRYQTARSLAAALRSVPLERPWTTVEASKWWKLHMPATEDLPAA